MARITTSIPVSDSFDYSGWVSYRDTLTPATRIWEPDNLDNMRLPGNTDIDEFLIYTGKVFNEWLTGIQYTAEKPVYVPTYPDIIYSLASRSGTVTGASPHQKIPPVICYEVTRRAPASMKGGKPFGEGKHWKFREYGDFRSQDGSVYRLRARWWENLVEFTAVARSGKEANDLCRTFEKFMDLNEGRLLEAGVGKVIPFGRYKQPDQTLDQAGLHYRKTFFYFRTQEFQFAGPITTISDTQIAAYANTKDE